jgi:hypothetical protein
MVGVTGSLDHYPKLILFQLNQSLHPFIWNTETRNHGGCRGSPLFPKWYFPWKECHKLAVNPPIFIIYWPFFPPSPIFWITDRPTSFLPLCFPALPMPAPQSRTVPRSGGCGLRTGGPETALGQPSFRWAKPPRRPWDNGSATIGGVPPKK